MKIKTTHHLTDIEFDQIAHGKILRKFVACDEGGNNRDYRVVIHGFVDEEGTLYITNTLTSSEPQITGAKP